MNVWKTAGLASVLAPLILLGCAGGPQGMRLVFGTEDWNELSVGTDPYAMGKRHLAQGRHGLAVKYFHSAVTRDPKSIEALNGLAATYDQLGRFELAEYYYRKALTQNPKSAQTLNNLGYSYMLQGKFDLAAAYLEDANREETTSPAINANRKTAIASLRQPATETRPTKVETEPEAEISIEPATTWIERTTAAVQTLVTRPAEILLSSLRDARVDSRFASHDAAESALPDKTPGPGFAPRPTIWTLLTAETLNPGRKIAAAVVDSDDSEPSPLMPVDFSVPIPPDTESVPEAVPVPAVHMAVLESPSAYISQGRSAPASEGTPPTQLTHTEFDQNVISSFVQMIQASGQIAATETEFGPSPREETTDTATAQVPHIVPASFQVPQLSEAKPVPPVAVVYTAAFRLQEVVKDEDRAERVPDQAAPEKAGETTPDAKPVSSFAQLIRARDSEAAVDSPPTEFTEREVTTVPSRPSRPVAEHKELQGPVAEKSGFRRENVARLATKKWEGLMIEISNGTGRRRMAARFRGYLAGSGVTMGGLTNADHFSHMETTIYFRVGFREQATNLSALFPVDIDLAQMDEQRADVRIELGGDLLEFDRKTLYPKEKSHEKSA